MSHRGPNERTAKTLEQIIDCLFADFMAGGNCMTVKQIADATGRDPATVRNCLYLNDNRIARTTAKISVRDANYGHHKYDRIVDAWTISRAFLRQQLQQRSTP